MLVLVAYLITFVSGMACALVAHSELRTGSAHIFSSRVCRAYGAYLLLVLVPATVYFYLFHGDWFLTYAVPSATIPSAVALLAVVLQVALGLWGFWVGAQLIRTEQRTLGPWILTVLFLLALLLLWIGQQRIQWVGSYEQYRGNYGLTGLSQDTSLRWSLVLFIALAAGGYGYLIFRLVRIRRA